MHLPFTISDLRQCPASFDIVADRIWRAWWAEQDDAGISSPP
jgi:hypothetical protein